MITRGSDALEMARQYRPTAISLDVFLPDMLGWTVLSQLKQNSLTRHIPVQVTTMDDNPQYALAGGAYSFFSKSGGSEELAARLAGLMEFANLGRKRLLVVEDSPAEASAVSELLGGEDIDIVSGGNRRGSAGSHEKRAIPLCGPRSQPAGHDRFRGSASHECR